MFHKIYLWWKDRRFRHLRNKSTESIFTDIYLNNSWGGNKGEFFSGSGSINVNTDLYIRAVSNLIVKNRIKSILELGCGDFRIMEKILSTIDVKYTGLDIVQPVIDFNLKTYGSENVNFEKKDIVESELPSADLVIIRQVLQHLSNGQIKKVLDKLSIFPLVLITEHLPINSKVIPNLDKITGSHIRMRINSGVFLDKPPFNMNQASVLLEYREDDPVKGRLVPAVIRTYIINNS